MSQKTTNQFFPIVQKTCKREITGLEVAVCWFAYSALIAKPMSHFDADATNADWVKCTLLVFASPVIFAVIIPCKFLHGTALLLAEGFKAVKANFPNKGIEDTKDIKENANNPTRPR
jgi:hypothetical protein